MRIRFLLPLAVVFFPAMAVADSCEFTIGSADSMSFDTRSIVVPASCESFTVTLQHNGRLPKTGMGHNWVLTRNADTTDVARAGASAGIANDFLPQDDSRIIAATPIIGGGESASVTFETALLSKDESYTYFCSFPGHSAMMRGSLTLAD
ncbi:azurin blue-copper protein [Methylophaga lonarensis MPL]|uniref:Azurin n=1 Tax=Methylophaga lonarensis MPL TaxID=1286106 RepID=M7P3A9_9GAMM|nr:azurin [Methylophaga lonarensis]EMR14006.1 azurin blue-copper protein [Methylophaga lonarensis MPL]